FSMGAKWVQTLKELAPATERIIVFGSRDNAGNVGLSKAAEAAAPQLGIAVLSQFVASHQEVENVMRAAAQRPNTGLVVLPQTFAVNNRALILALAAQYRIPAMYPTRLYTTEGGLASLDTDARDYYR